MSKTALQIVVVDSVIMSTRTAGAHSPFRGTVLLNPAEAPTSELPSIQVSVQRVATGVLDGERQLLSLDSQAMARAADGRLAWQFVCNLRPSGAMGSQVVLITAEASYANRSTPLRAIPAKSTLWYRGV
ncbi:hypothetical protein BKA62DRAFT_808196 [Auriculariales sp. MPI-PUGE-AT-0066]|nr:hypothetical protein BKA62DRAFT_808196 [Auriculariales sp. MPI-PUGE-AT-0066]